MRFYEADTRRATAIEFPISDRKALISKQYVYAIAALPFRMWADM